MDFRVSEETRHDIRITLQLNAVLTYEAINGNTTGITQKANREILSALNKFTDTDMSKIHSIC